MIATIWRFYVATASVEAFNSVYPTIDRWNTEAEFHAAKKLPEREYVALDHRCDAYTSEETWLGLHTICE